MSTRILITGAGSYIGEKAKTYLTEKYGYQIQFQHRIMNQKKKTL